MIEVIDLTLSDDDDDQINNNKSSSSSSSSSSNNKNTKISSSSSSSSSSNTTSSSSPNDDSETCSICLGSYTEKATLNKCSHAFCFECIMNWSKHENSCPNCKSSFTKILKIGDNGGRKGQKTVNVKSKKQQSGMYGMPVIPPWPGVQNIYGMPVIPPWPGVQNIQPLHRFANGQMIPLFQFPFHDDDDDDDDDDYDDEEDHIMHWMSRHDDDDDDEDDDDDDDDDYNGNPHELPRYYQYPRLIDDVIDLTGERPAGNGVTSSSRPANSQRSERQQRPTARAPVQRNTSTRTGNRSGVTGRNVQGRESASARNTQRREPNNQRREPANARNDQRREPAGARNDQRREPAGARNDQRREPAGARPQRESTRAQRGVYVDEDSSDDDNLPIMSSVDYDRERGVPRPPHNPNPENSLERERELVERNKTRKTSNKQLNALKEQEKRKRKTKARLGLPDLDDDLFESTTRKKRRVLEDDV